MYINNVTQVQVTLYGAWGRQWGYRASCPLNGVLCWNCTLTADHVLNKTVELEFLVHRFHKGTRPCYNIRLKWTLSASCVFNMKLCGACFRLKEESVISVQHVQGSAANLIGWPTFTQPVESFWLVSGALLLRVWLTSLRYAKFLTHCKQTTTHISGNVGVWKTKISCYVAITRRENFVEQLKYPVSLSWTLKEAYFASAATLTSQRRTRLTRLAS